MSAPISYTEPLLCHYNYDLKKAWFVYFDVTNEITGEVLRKQFRGGINRQPDKSNRLKDGKALIALWKSDLAKGLYNPFKKVDGQASIDAPKNVQEAIDRVYELKKASLKKSSVRSYKNISQLFGAWLAKNRFGILPLYAFNQNIAQAYFDYLVLELKYAGKTHNNNLNVLKGFFSVMKKRWPMLVKENPFVGIEMLPTDVGGNQAYTAKEREILINYFRENDRRLYYAIQFMFHCFIRKTELTYLKVGNIDWENGTITINSRSAKSRNQDSVTIPDSLLPILYEMKLDHVPKHHFIFGKGMQTVEEMMKRADDISDAHKAGKIAAGLPDNDGKAFYSWKHTGVVAYWGIIKDPYFMMRQLRHSDLKTTMIYMKSLGLMPNEAFKNAKVSI